MNNPHNWIGNILAAARPQAVAALLRYFRDLDMAEEAFQEASPAGAEGVAEERPAARRRGLADHGRPQRRRRRGAPAEAQRAAAAGGGAVRPLRRRDADAGAHRRGRLPRRHPAPAVRLLPSRAARHPADRAGAAHRLRPHRAADRARLPGQRRRNGAAHHPRQAPRRRRRRAVRGAGRRSSGPSASPPSPAWSIWSSTRATPPASPSRVRAPAVRGGDPARAPAAPPVPDRAGDHGADRADAAAARPRRRPASTRMAA